MGTEQGLLLCSDMVLCFSSALCNENDFPTSDKSIDMNGFLVLINTDGLGQIARAEEGRTFKFNDEYPAQSSVDHLANGTKLIIGAKAADGWRFVKWTLNGEDFSSESLLHYTIKENADFRAVFEYVE